MLADWVIALSLAWVVPLTGVSGCGGVRVRGVCLTRENPDEVAETGGSLGFMG